MLHLHGVKLRMQLRDPVAAIKQVSRDLTGDARLELANGGWTTPTLILQETLGAALAELKLDQELADVCTECLRLLELLQSDFTAFSRSVDWAAKYTLLQQVADEDGAWDNTKLQAYCLEYQNISPEDGLLFAMIDADMVDAQAELHGDELATAPVGSRAIVRGTAVHKFADRLVSASWRSIVIRDATDRVVELDLAPNVVYPESIRAVSDVESFINLIRQSQ